MRFLHFNKFFYPIISPYLEFEVPVLNPYANNEMKKLKKSSIRPQKYLILKKILNIKLNEKRRILLHLNSYEQYWIYSNIEIAIKLKSTV